MLKKNYATEFTICNGTEGELVDAIFRRFTGAVRAARGYDDEALARVTTGEVWLGTRAAELGLIDGLADDEDTALEAAQDLASLPHLFTKIAVWSFVCAAVMLLLTPIMKRLMGGVR